MYPYLHPDHVQHIAAFMQTYGIEAAIERVEHNPMGPDSWREQFIHYALWFSNRALRKEIPLYFSYDKSLAQLPTNHPLRREMAQPTLNFTFAHMAKTMADIELAANDFQVFCRLSQVPTTEDMRFYFEQLNQKSVSLWNFLGEEGYQDFIRIGEMRG